MREALDYVKTLEAKALPTAACWELARTFRDGLREVGESDPRRRFVAWEVALYDYQLPDPRATDQARQLRPTPVEEFPEDAVNYLKLRLDEAQHPSARARLADFLWLRTKDYRYADTAIDEYLQAAEAVFGGEFGGLEAGDYLIRAVRLARMLGRDGQHLRDSVKSMAERLLDKPVGCLCRLVEGAAEEIVSDPDFGRALLQKILARADAHAAAGGRDRFAERAWLQAARRLAGTRRDHETVRALSARMGQSLEQEGEERASDGGLIQSALFQEALGAYAALGLGKDVERLKGKVHEASQKAKADLKPVSVEVEVPIDALRQEVESMLAANKGREAWSHLVLFAFSRSALWPQWSAISASVEEHRAQFPLQFLASVVILSPDGRPLPRPTDPVKEREFDEIRRYTQNVELCLPLYTMQVEMFRERQAWSVDLLLRALANGALFSGEVIDTVRPGILAFEEGRHWEAVHVLIPQIERVIRALASGVRAEVYRYDPATGEIQWKALNFLLREPPMVEVLAKIRPDLGRELAYLLADSRGLNLRNEVAHGILAPHRDTAAFALLCVLILLSLSALQQRGASSDAGDAKEEAVDDSRDCLGGGPLGGSAPDIWKLAQHPHRHSRSVVDPAGPVPSREGDVGKL